jgi:hypothetical protein
MKLCNQFSGVEGLGGELGKIGQLFIFSTLLAAN